MNNELSPEQRQENLVSPEKERHHLFIGVQGATGVGKTGLAKLLVREFGVVLVEEKFRKNPYLEDFYKEPGRWSCLSQTFFFEQKVRDLATMPKNEPVVLAPDQWQDRDIYAFVHRLMGWMTHEEYQTYLDNCDRLLRIASLPAPDIVISVQAPISVILDRIRKRAEEENREFELWMLKNHPEYFFELSRRVIEWAKENPYNVPIIVVDSDRFNYVDDSRHARLVSYQIERGVFDALRERREVILPESFRPRQTIDTRPGTFSKMDNPLRRRI